VCCPPTRSPQPHSVEPVTGIDEHSWRPIQDFSQPRSFSCQCAQKKPPDAEVEINTGGLGSLSMARPFLQKHLCPERPAANLHRRHPRGLPVLVLKFLDVSGVFDYVGLSRSSRYRSCSCCLRRISRASASGLHLFGAEYPPRLSSVYASLCPSR